MNGCGETPGACLCTCDECCDMAHDNCIGDIDCRDVQSLRDEIETLRNQVAYEQQARIDAANFPRNRYGYIPCQRCGIDCGMDCILPNDVWAQICPEPEWPEAGAYCLWCIDELLDAKGIQDVEGKVYFSGKVLWVRSS